MNVEICQEKGMLIFRLDPKTGLPLEDNLPVSGKRLTKKYA
jgi:hypothetical protein